MSKSVLTNYASILMSLSILDLVFVNLIILSGQAKVNVLEGHIETENEVHLFVDKFVYSVTIPNALLVGNTFTPFTFCDTIEPREMSGEWTVCANAQ
jgi:hypothetical protein